MPDAWTLITPDGPLELNPTFHTPKYQPGGVGAPGALRRDDRVSYQRSGDGLPTPGPLILQGRVWRDDRNTSLLVQELNAIRQAVATCTSVTRANNAGRYTYSHLAGGPTPEVIPDGLGGWEVTIELWPGRAEPTILPPGFDQDWAHFRQSSAGGAWSDTITTDLMSVFATTSPHGDAPGDPQMLSWEGLRAAKAGLAEFDALVRVRCAAFPESSILSPGVAVFVRLPTAPFAPGSGLAHILRRHGTGLELFYGVFNPASTPPAGSTHTFLEDMTVGAWYWMRLQVTRDASNEHLKGKMWLDGDTEPDWQVTRSAAIANSSTPALGGAIGVANSGGGGSSLTPLRRYEWNHVQDIST